MATTEQELIDRHVSALKEAKDACQELGRNADPDYIAVRGPHYRKLREALNLVEGTCRQLCAFRDDTRWLPLGIHYAKVMRLVQRKFVEQKWSHFRKLAPMFDIGLRQMQDLKDRRTGRRGSILIENPAPLLWMPDHKPALRGPGTVH